MQRPFLSQSPYLVGSGPRGPPKHKMNIFLLIFVHRLWIKWTNLVHQCAGWYYLEMLQVALFLGMDAFLPIDLRIIRIKERNKLKCLFFFSFLNWNQPSLPIGVFARSFSWNSSMRGLIGRFLFAESVDGGGGGVFEFISSFEWNLTLPITRFFTK